LRLIVTAAEARAQRRPTWRMPNGVAGYSYDQAGRLVGVTTNGVNSSSYSYDTNSNRLSATTASGTAHGTYDAQDRALTYGNASFTYSSNGDLVSRTAASQTTTYMYDVLGNLTAVHLPTGVNITYIVDSWNRRVGKRVSGVLQNGFLYDSEQLVAQLDGSNQIVNQFLHGMRQTSPDVMIRGGVTYRIFSDHLGSPRLVVNSSTGAITQRMDYDEFGNVLNDTNPGFQPFGFAGGIYDTDTKLVRFGARDYDPILGRWTAKDPILFAGGDTNLYGYVFNDPINWIDPSGLDGECSACKDKKLSKYLVSRGKPLPLIGRLLGHTQPGTTQRYAHIADAPLRDVANDFGNVLAMPKLRA
jgi:RHS repeat-associated protein